MPHLADDALPLHALSQSIYLPPALMPSDADPFVSSSPVRQPSTPPIFLRDFAYPHSARVVLNEQMRMASERSIAKSLARDFAEYVHHHPSSSPPATSNMRRHVALPGHSRAIALVVDEHCWQGCGRG